jgi:tetratricopeptide (TPR) repeat protein
MVEMNKLNLPRPVPFVAGLSVFWISLCVQWIVPARAARHPAVHELARVGVYLAYFDQWHRIAVARNQLSVAEADTRLRNKAAELYHRSFTQAELDQLVGQHQQMTGAYFAQVEQEANASARWPRGMSVESGRYIARGMLDNARREYQSAVGARRDPLQGLLIATVVRGFALGYDTPPASIDVFSGQWERIANSMPSPASRAVMGRMVAATRSASLASAQTGPRPIPGEMGRPTPPPPAGGIARVPPGGTMPPTATDEITRGNAFFQQGRYHEALAAFDNALRGNPHSAPALLGRGLSLNALGDPASARLAYESALQINPSQPNLRSWIAEVAIASNDFQRAEAILGEELRFAPSSAWAYSYVGTLRMLQGRQEEARQAMAAAMQLDSAVVSYRYQNATFLSGVGQSQRAIVEFWSVILLDPNAAGAYYGIGVQAARLGQTAQAIQAYQSYLNYDGTSEWARLARQEIQRLRGR